MRADTEPDVVRLRKLIRDLVALSSVPEAWVGKEPRAIAADFADLLETSLSTDFAFVRLRDPNVDVAVEVIRGNGCPTLLERLNHYVAYGVGPSRSEVIQGSGGGAETQHAIIVPIGVNAERGLVAVACNRPNFPDEDELLLLSVSVHHTATAFRMSCLVEEQQRVEAALRSHERQLRQTGDELEMKVAERAAELRRNESYLVESQRLSHTGTWACNGTMSLYVYWSDECYRIWDFDPLRGLPDREIVWQRIHPDDRDGVLDQAQEAMRQKRDYRTQFRIVLPDGTVKHLESVVHHLCSEDGELVQVVGTNFDLTDRKYAELALRESEAKFRDYAETASDWFWEIDPDYKFTLLTENAFGSRATERIGTACWDYALDLDAEPEKWRSVWATLHEHKSFRDFVYCTAGGDGAPMYVRASGKPVFDSNGEFRGYRGTGTDVTALISAKEENDRLRQLESDLAHMNRLSIIGEQAASLVHEITQPIAAARNNAKAALNFLKRQPPDLGEVTEALDSLVADTNRAREMIDRIRDHIKKAPPQKLHFDLNQAIKEVILLGRSAITQNGVSVRTHLGEELLPVEGDRVQLQQVVLNLVLNAVEAMSAVEVGPRELMISTEQTPGNSVLVMVCDSGPGIDPEHVERVFDAFYSTKTTGIGMGLSICRSIIHAHGGRLWAVANEPRGAVFQFTLRGAECELTNGEVPEGTVSIAPVLRKAAW